MTPHSQQSPDSGLLNTERRAAGRGPTRTPSAPRTGPQQPGVPSRCPDERTRAVNSGQPWHLPWLPCLSIGLRPALPDPVDSASQARGDLVVLVRAGSVPHREPAGVGGHERSRRVWTNRRSAALQRLDLESTNRVAQSSSLPTRLRRALRPLALETVVTEDGPPLRPSREPSSPGRTIAALTGRAAHVQWRGWTKRSSPTMRAKRAVPLGADRLVHLELQ